VKKEEGKKYTGHKIKKVLPSSIAMEVGIEAGDWILTVNGKEIQDIFDYQYYMEEEYVEVLVRKSFGEEWLLEIDKEEDEDLGITFESGLMDEYRSCKNKCIFCFIDQMPKGMRETLYFKDDDTRLSFLQGNYVTLTNLSDEDIERIIRYRLSPMNISFQTTNPKLRCQMLNNRFAGEALNKANQLYKAGISMNGQIVLCKGVNDKKELHRSIDDLTKYAPVLQSLSVVPVGLSKYREGLYPLSPFSKKDAKEVIVSVPEESSVNQTIQTPIVVPELNLDETTRGEELLEMLRRNNPENKDYELIEAVVSQYIENLAIGIQNLISIFEPEAIGIGGSFVYFEDVFLDRLKKTLQDINKKDEQRKNIKVVPAVLGNDAGIIGAVL